MQRPVRFRYESEAGARVDDPSSADLRALLSRLDGVDESYASLTALDGGGYVQVGGGPDWFTVEVRETRRDGPYKHLRAARQADSSTERRLSIGGAEVVVRADEVLDRQTVEQVFSGFIAGFLDSVPLVWHNITAMFAATS